jgi:hypothetical protein
MYVGVMKSGAPFKVAYFHQKKAKAFRKRFLAYYE